MKIIIISILLGLNAFAAVQAITSPLRVIETGKLVDADGDSYDHLGSNIAISGYTVVMGIETDDCVDGYACGSIVIFEYDTSTFTYNQVAKINNPNAQAGDNFGNSVSIDDDTIVVGAHMDDYTGNNNAGSVYVFEKPASGGWTNTTAYKVKLVASNFEDRFGKSVAIQGDTIVVGSPNNDLDGKTKTGSACVFVKPDSGWASSSNECTAFLSASDKQEYDFFGNSVAVSGDTVVVGAWEDDAEKGAAYIFQKSASGEWSDSTQTAKLTALDAQEYDLFAYSVDIAGDTVVVGTDNDSAYIFVRPENGIWVNSTQTAKLTALDGSAGDDDFGQSVAISGTRVVIGSEGDSNSNGTSSGSVYIFDEPFTGWKDSTIYKEKLIASDGSAVDYFGSSVAIDGLMVAVGANHSTITSLSESGSAYTFQKKLLAQNSIENKKEVMDIEIIYSFPGTVTYSLNGGDASFFDIDTLGNLSFKNAPDFEVPLDFNTDNIYESNITLTHSEGSTSTYAMVIKVSDLDYEGGPSKSMNYEELNDLIASDHSTDNDFGYSVAINGLTAIIGAKEKAYIYEYDASTDNFIQKAIFDLPDSTGLHASSVSIGSNTAIVGVKNSNNNKGAVYLYEKPEEGWHDITTWPNTLTASDGEDSDRFGNSVDICGDTIVVGAEFENAMGYVSGSAYVFQKPSTGWTTSTESGKLMASDGEQYDGFGIGVAVSGDTIVIGASGVDLKGAIYIFEKPIVGWMDANENKKLIASDGAAYDGFGVNVDIDGDKIVIGTDTDKGFVYIFEKAPKGWKQSVQKAKLITNESNDHRYVWDVAISDNIIIAGTSEIPSLYIFEQPFTGWIDTNTSREMGSIDIYDLAISGDSIVVGNSQAEIGKIYKTKKSNDVLVPIITYLLN